ncbi:MAG: ABC transporter permease [Azonexaceae bacterium]|nr:ABC transporter permease [Azonexaceae bacterium]
MQFLLFALRNIFRHRARSAATLAAISIGVASLILAGGFVKDIFIQLGEAIIHSQTGHIQVTRQGYQEGKNRAPENYLIEKAADLRAELAKNIPATEVITSRLSFNGTLNNGKRDLGIIGEGIEASLENKMGTYLQFVSGRPLKDTDFDGIVIGQGVAKSLGLKTGDRVTLLATLAQGAVNTLDFEIVGIFQSFSKDFDARAVRIPLESAQKLMDTSAIHMLVVVLKKTETTAEATIKSRQLLSGRGFDATSWNKISDFYEKTVELYDRQFGVLKLIILIMVLLSVANSINMTLFERTREFGTMKAIGDRSSDVFKLITTESLCLGALGALLGMLIGTIAAITISAIGIPMPPPPNANLGYSALIRLDAVSVIVAGTIGFTACVLASLIPARRASRIDIGEALRHGV